MPKPRPAVQITERIEYRKRVGRNARRWTNAKLERELAFAVAAVDDSVETQDWLAALQLESDRRRIADTARD